MKDEINEIIERLKRIDHKEYIAFEFADSATFDEMARCFEERKKMADYITNLQEENERLREVVENLTTMTVCGDRKQIKNTAQFKLEQCQSRIDKAIEYITSYEAIETIQQFDHSKNNEDLDGATIDEMTRRYLEVHDNLLNILQGENNE